jgi:hypothetical protein
MLSNEIGCKALLAEGFGGFGVEGDLPGDRLGSGFGFGLVMEATGFEGCYFEGCYIDDIVGRGASAFGFEDTDRFPSGAPSGDRAGVFDEFLAELPIGKAGGVAVAAGGEQIAEESNGSVASGP